MCILLKDSKLSVAEKPIKAYKIIACHGNNSYCTPYQSSTIPDMCVAGKENFIAGGLPVLELTSNERFAEQWWSNAEEYKYVVNGGMIHCYVNLEDATEDLKGWPCGYASYFLVEVEIPAGVEYVKGELAFSSDGDEDLDRAETIAAREIRFVKVVTSKICNMVVNTWIDKFLGKGE